MDDRTVDFADDDAPKRHERKRSSDADLRRLMSVTGLEMLVAIGYAKMNVNDVARRACIPLRTAMRLAPTPLQLLTVVVQETLDSFLSQIALAMNGPDQRSSLTAILTNCARFVLNENVIALNRIVISERDLYPEIAEVFYAEGVERVPVALAAWLSLERDRSRIDVDDCGTVAKMLIGMVTSDIHRSALLGRRLPSAEGIRLRAELCATLFLNGCATGQ
jgi:AcrR family transcriptional regulator